MDFKTGFDNISILKYMWHILIANNYASKAPPGGGDGCACLSVCLFWGRGGFTVRGLRSWAVQGHE